MSTRLTGLRLTKIDRVDRGAQPDAHITLVKRRIEKAHTYSDAGDGTCETCGKTENYSGHSVQKLMDPASMEGVRAAICEDFSDEDMRDDDGCYLCVEGVYDGYLIACNGMGTDFYRYDYTLGDDGEYTFDDPQPVKPTVSWGDAPGEELPEGDGDLTTTEAVDPSNMMGYVAQATKTYDPIAKRTFTADQRQAAADAKHALSDGSYPIETKGDLNNAIQALGRAGSKRGQVIALIRRRAKDLGVDLSGSSVPELSKSQPIKKEATVPTDISTLDLSALDDATREAVTTLATERDEALAKATEPEASAPVAEADLTKALDAISDPNVRALLKSQADENAELRKAAQADRERSERLEKAERARVFKTRADVLKAVAPHAGGTDDLADMLDAIDKSAGSEVAAKVESMLTAANTQINELVGTLTEKGHTLHIVAPDSVDEEIETAVKAVMTADPTISVHKARVQVLASRPDLAQKALG